MLKQTLTICNKKGLHARAAAKLSSKVADYQSHVMIKYQQQTVAADSVIQLMLLSPPYGTEIELIVDGTDEQIAIKGLIDLIQSGFDENE